MMYQKIKDIHQKARLDRSKLTPLWSTILGDLQKAEKNGIAIDDSKVIATLKSFHESAAQMLSYGNEDARAEVNALLELIPAQMDAVQIEDVIRKSGVANLGLAMKSMKENHAGTYDGKLAQTVAKTIFG